MYCSYCGNDGVIDSGGYEPCGTPINIPCPNCSKNYKSHIYIVPAYTKDIPTGHWVEYVCPYCNGGGIERYVGRDNDIIEKPCEACGENGWLLIDTGAFKEDNND